MHEILSALPPGSIVLDLGSARGSFDARLFPFTVVRADLQVLQPGSGDFVACSASALPFATGSFNAIILNHSLEHFEHLQECVAEIARVLDASAFLYVAVPDANTFTDRVYRWLGRGGGHINLFSNPSAIPEMMTQATGLRHAGTRVLCTSLSFLNRRNLTSKPQRKLALFAYGHEGFLRALTLFLRYLDRWLGWRTSVYGWAFYFGNPLTPDSECWSNVCVRCGSGHPASLLKKTGIVKRHFRPPVYACPKCAARNFFTDDDVPKRSA